MTKSPLVSVLLTTYNRSSYLVHAIESIKNQTLSDWELIIVDDGSSDDTFEVASKYAKSDKRIQAVTQNNSGLATALNTGLALAKGQYVTRQDDDDLCHPYRLECMVSHLYRKPELKAVVSTSDRMGAEEAFVQYVDWMPKTNQYRFLRLPHNRNNPWRVINNASTLFCREILEEYKGWRPFFKYGEDYDLALRLETEHPVGVVNYPFYKCRYTPNIPGQMTGEIDMNFYGYAAVISHYCRMQGMKDPVEEGDDLYQILEQRTILPEIYSADVRFRARVRMKEIYPKFVKILIHQKKYTKAHDLLQKMRIILRCYYDGDTTKFLQMATAFKIKQLESKLWIHQKFSGDSVSASGD